MEIIEAAVTLVAFYCHLWRLLEQIVSIADPVNQYAFIEAVCVILCLGNIIGTLDDTD